MIADMAISLMMALKLTSSPSFCRTLAVRAA